MRERAISKCGLLTPLESMLASNPRESCGYVDIPKVRIDAYSTRAFALGCSLENYEQVLVPSTISLEQRQVSARASGPCAAIT